MEDLRDKMNSLLKNIWDDRGFLLGVNGSIRNEYAVKKMVDYLERNKEIELDPSDVLETALYIRFGDSVAHKLNPEVVKNCKERGI